MRCDLPETVFMLCIVKCLAKLLTHRVQNYAQIDQLPRILIRNSNVMY